VCVCARVCVFDGAEGLQVLFLGSGFMVHGLGFRV
jgi:hypothetical protein